MLRRLQHTFDYLIWQQAQPTNELTFNRSPVDEIDPRNKIILDSRYEDIEEVKEYIEFRINEEKTPFVNPATHTPMQEYSTVAISIIKGHPACKELIGRYEQQQKEQFSQLALPRDFYDILHVYLKKLLEIGRNNVFSAVGAWGFGAKEISACVLAKAEFIQQIDARLSDDERQAVEHKIISVPLVLGAPVEEKLSTMMHGSSPYECVIIQQIFLWKFLTGFYSEVDIPREVINHNDARLYNLQRTNSGWLFFLLVTLPNFLVQLYMPPVIQNIDRRNLPLHGLLLQRFFVGRYPAIEHYPVSAVTVVLIYSLVAARAYMLRDNNEVGSLAILAGEYQVSMFSFAKAVGAMVLTFTANICAVILGLILAAQVLIDLTQREHGGYPLIIPMTIAALFFPAIQNLLSDFNFASAALLSYIRHQPEKQQQENITTITATENQGEVDDRINLEGIKIPRTVLEDKTQAPPYHQLTVTLYRPPVEAVAQAVNSACKRSLFL